MDSDLSRVTDYLVVFVHVGSPEVYEDINNEHDIHDEVDDGKRVLVTPIRVVLVVAFVRGVVKKKRRHVRGKYRRVDDKNENKPVPNSFEGGIMQNGEAVNPRCLEFVFGKDFCSKWQYLKI